MPILTPGQKHCNAPPPATTTTTTTQAAVRASPQLIQGLQATAPRLVVPGQAVENRTPWIISRSVRRLAVDHVVALAAILVPHRTNASSLVSPKARSRSTSCFCPSTQQLFSRSWMLEMLRRTSGHKPQPPAWFRPAAAVCRVSYLVRRDMHAVAVALMCTTASIFSDCPPLCIKCYHSPGRSCCCTYPS
jgi:hypothetical protein